MEAMFLLLVGLTAASAARGAKAEFGAAWSFILA
jgi:hypothetical protein